MGVFECLVVDYIKLPQTTVTLTGQQVEYCLTLVDRVSHWCVLAPTADCTAKTTAMAIQTHWIAQFGYPLRIYSDLGSSFTSGLFTCYGSHSPYKFLIVLYGDSIVNGISCHHRGYTMLDLARAGP